MTKTDHITQREIEIKRNEMFQYDNFFSLSQPGFIIPGLHQDLIPQGFAYLEKKNWLLISYYREGDAPSVVTVVDATTQVLIKTIHLHFADGSPYTEHAGGVAVNDKYLWVSSSSKLHYMKLDKILSSDYTANLSFDGIMPIDVNGSFVKVVNNTLWVGEFAHSDNYTTNEEHHMKTRTNVTQKAWITGYELDLETGFVPENENNKDQMPVPNYILSIPYRIQGMAIQKDQVFLSQSYGRTADSQLLVFTNPTHRAPHSYIEVEDATVPLWFLDDLNHNQTITMPPMAESLAQSEDKLHVLFESGADKYRHDGSYPLDKIYTLNL